MHGGDAAYMVQVFLETESVAPFEAVYDTMAHVTAISGHPLFYKLLKRGLMPGYRRYRRNWRRQHAYHCGAALASISMHGPYTSRSVLECLQPSTLIAPGPRGLGNNYPYICRYHTSARSKCEYLSASTPPLR